MTRGKKYWTNVMYDKKDWRQKRWADLDSLHWILIAFMGLFLFVIVGLAIKKFDYEHKYEEMKAINELERSTIEHVNQIEKENSHLKNRISELEAVEKRSGDDIFNYITKYYPRTPKSVAAKIAECVLKKSSEYDVSFVAIMGVMEQESSFNPYSESTAGARGLMQVMYTVWGKKLELASPYALHDIEIGIDSGVRVLREYLDDTRGSYKKALYKYIGGPNPMYRKFRATTTQKKYAEDVFAAMGRFTLYRSVIVSDDTDEDEKEEMKIVEPKKFIHKVSFRGETLGLISRWYTGKTSNWKAIAIANPDLDPHKLMMDSEIVIPDDILKNRTPMPEKFVKEHLTPAKKEVKEENPEISMLLH